MLVADPNDSGGLRLARFESDPAVVGIVSGEPGVLLGGGSPAVAGREWVPVAFSGVVICKVDAGYGSIRVGDLLTTSPTLGHAMRADDPRLGTIVAKALEPLEYGMGRIKVLVMQH